MQFAVHDQLPVGRWLVAEQPPGLGRVQPAERGYVVPVLPREHRVGEHRDRGQQPGAHRADPDERAGRELEVLGDPAAEDQPGRGVGWVGERDRVAGPVEAVGVERRRGQVRPAEVAGRHHRAAHPDLAGVAVGGHQLDLRARQRHTDAAGVGEREVRAGHRWCGLGGAPGPGDRDLAADGAFGDGREPVAERGGQRGGGVEHQPQPGEETGSELRVGFQRWHQLRVSRWDVEVDGRRHVGEVPDRLPEQRRHGPPRVDVQCAARADHHVQVVIAAERVAPRQPVHDHRPLPVEERPGLSDHLLVRGEHPMRVQHALRRPGRAGGEKDLRRSVRAEVSEGCPHRLARIRIHQNGQLLRLVPVTRAHDGGDARQRVERRLEGCRVRGEHGTRADQPGDVPDPRVVPALQ